jgi:hypothetical protein
MNILILLRRFIKYNWHIPRSRNWPTWMKNIMQPLDGLIGGFVTGWLYLSATTPRPFILMTHGFCLAPSRGMGDKWISSTRRMDADTASRPPSPCALPPFPQILSSSQNTPILLPNLPLQCPRSISFLSLFLHWTIHFHHKNLFHSVWCFLPPTSGAINPADWFIPAVQFTHPSISFHSGTILSRERERERERERLGDLLNDWSCVMYWNRGQKKCGVLCILGFGAEFGSYRDSTKRGVVLGLWGSV